MFELNIKPDQIHPNFSLSEHANVIHHAWLFGIYFSPHKLVTQNLMKSMQIGLQRLFIENKVDFSEFLELKTSASCNPIRELWQAHSFQFFQPPFPVLASISNFFCDALKNPMPTVQRNVICF